MYVLIIPFSLEKILNTLELLILKTVNIKRDIEHIIF